MASGVLLDALVAHITLPPRLPFRDDNGGGAVDTALARRLVKQARFFRDIGDTEYYNQWCIVCRALSTFVDLHSSSGHLSKDIVKDALLDISKSESDFLIIHVATQNAGLIIRKENREEYIVEAFEASAKAVDVLSSVHALQWDFPSHAVAISSDTFNDPGFQEHLAGFLERVSIESVKEFAATTAKAGSDAFESRDTASPVLIGHLLIALLETTGHARATPITRKRVRDDVCWSDGAKNPWRRSAAWLVLRVGLQRSLCALFGSTTGTLHYKFFVAYFIANLCEEMCEAQPIKSDYLAHVRAKLARRLAKLQIRPTNAPPALVSTIQKMFSSFETVFISSLKVANDKLAAEWMEIRQRSQKRIPWLPKRAEDSCLVLSLVNSGEHLRQLCQTSSLNRMPLRSDFDVSDYSKLASTSTRNGFDVYQYLKLFHLESQVELRSPIVWPPQSQLTVQDQCFQLADRIRQYQRNALSAYSSDPEQLSQMLLTIMELWTALDLMVIQLFPLLAEYRSGIPDDVLQVLQIARFPDLGRLQEIESHLQRRQKAANPIFPSVFSDPSERSFAVHFFDQSPSMQELFLKISSDGDKARELKEQEWKRKTAECENLLKRAAESTCLYTERMDKFGNITSVHNWHDCQKCQLESAAKKVRIAVHEYPLPDDPSAAKVAVFELLCPREFAAWRDTTWSIVNSLGRKLQPEDKAPHVLLGDYSELRGYGVRGAHVISLASKSKSFLKTHYLQLGFPVPLEKVCLPNGLWLGLYDQQQKLWTARYTTKPNFADLCTSTLPPKSSFSSSGSILRAVSENTVASANEIIAGQTECPTTLTVFEYQSFQELSLGLKLRWIQILRELASPSLNFGTPATVTLVSQLVLQAGRPWEDHILRASHWVFQDDQFCAAFVTQIKKRLTATSTNWRESQTLECLVTMVQRLWELGKSTKAIDQAAALLRDIRATTLGWTRLLRREILNGVDGKFAQARSRDALLAALLCRRTFVLEAYAYNKSDSLDFEALACFIECSIVLNDNMPEAGPGRLSKLPSLLRNMFVRDLRLVHHMQSKLRHSILATGIAVDRALSNIWPEPENAPRRAFTPWNFLAAPNEHWIRATSIGMDNSGSQEVLFDVIEGKLLVDRQPLSRLPDEYTKGGCFQQFLGDRLCLTYPSSIPGMRYVLAGLIGGNQIHLGLRGGTQILRVLNGRQMLEFIPPEVFLGSDTAEIADLPISLVNKHTHWLDLATGQLQIRPQTTKWRSKYSDWTVNIWTAQARRRKSSLVDPRSVAFQRIATILEPFAHRNQMIVYQPDKGNLSVTLPVLEMTFWVNGQGLLESRHLQSVIDDNQDAGTLYGLESKLVLRDVSNPRERSILVAMGPAKIQRYRGHVRVINENSRFYCRFTINSILNRLECPAEPRVVYMKAFCHAITAFVLADPLTGRTGTEEALHCLSSGNAQPWTPVDEEAYRLLSCIASLTPKRFYYPQNMKVQQRVVWMESLAFPSQHDGFLPSVTRILRQCRELYRFNAGPIEPPLEGTSGDVYLLERARARNDLHRLHGWIRNRQQVSDAVYVPRDRVTSLRQTDAFEAAMLVRRWSSRIHVCKDLASIMEGWPVIQGYHNDHSFEPYLLDELISLDVGARWGSLFKYCQNLSRVKDSYKAMFFFATIAFGRSVDMIIVRTLIAFAVMQEFQSLTGPKWDEFTRFRKAQAPTIDLLVQTMGPSIFPYPEDERSLLGELSLNNKQRRKLESEQNKYEKAAKQNCETIAQYLLSQWPCEIPSLAVHDTNHFIDLDRAILLVRSEWQFLFKNHELWVHLQNIQRLLDSCGPTTEIPLSQVEKLDRNICPEIAISDTGTKLQDVMTAAMKSNLKNQSNIRGLDSAPGHEPSASNVNVRQRVFDIGPMNFEPTKQSPSEIQQLQSIIDPFVRHDDPVRQAYGEYLQSSLDALRGLVRNEVSDPLSIDRSRLMDAISSCRNAVESQFKVICATLNRNPLFGWLSRGGLWPSFTPITLLETLGSSSQTKASGHIKNDIVDYAELITILQRLLRIETAIRRIDEVKLRGELENEGHGEWRPLDYPDWILLEIESNILIRTDQCRVAKAMITPHSRSNSVLQMNMGQGKSSIIIPMIATVLADRKQIFRVIVPKPLLLQMGQLLQARLGALLGRTVKHVPFSRRSSTSMDNIQAYWDLHQETLEAQGVILALPEHLLSFKLSGLQRLSSGKVEEAAFMMMVQSWLLSRFRDVLDECDHSLAVKTQLVYPSGAQSMIDGHPNRWKVVQAILRLSKSSILQLQRDFPRSVEVTCRFESGAFPAVYFSQAPVKDALIKHITDSVCRGEGGILPINDCSKDELDAIVSFLNNTHFPKEKTSKVLNIFKDRPAARQDLLLLRGLLVHRILLMALSKRWNVQYGLHPTRDPVAVPYTAKGKPSEQAEFGHPDVAILLTCLSHYYSGLGVTQFEKVLKFVLKSDDPALDYDRWVQSADSLPESLRSWAAINVDDELQCQELWNHLQYNTVVIDCFLNNFVFPYHAKTFQRKLVTSGWDIPLPPSFQSPMAHGRSTLQKTSEPTQRSLSTGFSGTNDNRTLLPLNIEQRDLDGLAHTNAEVLTYLLQPRNRRYIPAADVVGRRLTEYDFLELICKNGIRMLLDAGAQILELDNFNLAKTWLNVDNKAEAAVYFDEDDKAWVLYRDERRMPLAASPFNDNLGSCVVYLDEAHTRGTDLKMPANAVAALTLGPGQTKDHTVQAAMRLRHLATLQSVVFFAPPEVHQSILSVAGKGWNDTVYSHDVISWLLEQTCRSIEQIQPLYISQGIDYCQRTLSALANQKAASDGEHRARYLNVLEQPEQYSLEHLYGPRKKAKVHPVSAADVPLLEEYSRKLIHMRETLRDTTDTVQALAHSEVEQEREVAIEVETVREVKKPPRATALKPLPLHQDIISFARRGRILSSSGAYEQAFVAMRRTAVGQRYGINSTATESKLYVTSDFMATIRTPRGQPRDEYLRPVQWILWSTVSEAAMIISPPEAEALIDDLRFSTHLICYAAPVTRSMLAFDTLRFYSMPCLPAKWRAPRWLVRDLGIFAGRLYFDYENYPGICEAIGIPPPDDVPLEADRWDELPFSEVSHQVPKTFSKAPLEFLHKWLSARRKGQDFSQTPMGHVCSGKEVKRNSVFFVSEESVVGKADE